MQFNCVYHYIIMKLTPEDIRIYRENAQKRWEQSSAERARLTEQAWISARRAAAILKDRFGITRVSAFGSLIHPGSFTRWSDIDLAAWGISPKDTFKAIGVMMDLDEPFEINLVDINTARSSLREVIEREGVDI